MKLHLHPWRLTLFIIILLTSVNICQAQHSVTGQVFSSSDQTPVAGATVVIKGAKGGTVTDADGRFSIRARTGDVLLITGVGITSQEVAVGSENNISIPVVAVTKDLNEVVVTALGIKKEKRAIGFATQEVKGEALEKARESNVVNSLNGRVAGLTVSTATTLFENSSIYIRGQVPVFVIDGIVTQSDTWNLNPDDIETITVLKSDAAALLYGSPGINGAIQITTKKGKSGANGFEIAVNETFQADGGFLNLPKTQTQYGMGWSGYYAFIDGQGGKGSLHSNTAFLCASYSTKYLRIATRCDAGHLGMAGAGRVDGLPGGAVKTLPAVSLPGRRGVAGGD